MPRREAGTGELERLVDLVHRRHAVAIPRASVVARIVPFFKLRRLVGAEVGERVDGDVRTIPHLDECVGDLVDVGGAGGIPVGFVFEVGSRHGKRKATGFDTDAVAFIE